MKAVTPFNAPSLVGDELKYIQDAVERGQLAGDGYFTHRCNQLIVEKTGASKALVTHSCTAALEMAAILCNLEAGDEVILPSFTFVSTANALVLRGAVPVFVDIDDASLNLDPALVEAAITPRTRAIFAVHYAGFPADMDALAELARKHDLLLVEDAAQALGSTYKGRPAGSLGDIAAFSFHETKNIISGEGGAITLNRPELFERAEIIREKGTNRSLFFRGQVDKYTWVDVGSSYLPGELISAFLLAQLEQEERIRAIRLAQYDTYSQAFAGLADQGIVRLPSASADTTGNGHMFYLRLADLDARTAFIAAMKSRGITCPFHYVPLHSSPAGKRFGRAHGGMAVTDHVTDTLVRLPMFFSLGDAIERVVDEVCDIASTLKRIAE